MKFNQSAHNQRVPLVPSTPTAGGAVPAPSFVQLLAQSGPQQQKQLIQEQLYRQIYTLQFDLTGKITGIEADISAK